MAPDRNLLRHGLRKRRTSLAKNSLLETSAGRRGAFAPAMQQFEELMHASSQVGPASRAITLYYATVQAGLAIAAARKKDPWSFASHGLKIRDVRSAVETITVGPDGTGAFQIVAESTGSEFLQTPVSIGSLWSSLPDFQGLQFSSCDEPRALVAYAEGDWVKTSEGMPTGRYTLDLFIEGDPPGAERFAEHLRSLLREYPWSDNLSVVEASYRQIRANRWTAEIACDGQPDIEQVAPAYRFIEDRFMRPRLRGHDARPPSALMTWWALLYAFSMLSRYHPRE